MKFTTIFIAATMAVAASATCTKDCTTTTQVDVSPPAEKTNVPTDEYTVDTPSTEETDEDTEDPEDDEYPVEEDEEVTEASYDASPVEDGKYTAEALTEPSKNTTAKTTTPPKNSTAETTTPSKNSTTKATTPPALNKTVKYDDTNILSGASSMTLSGAVILAAAAAFF
ncbi:hypothetical protein BASA50_001512 [Batrachochytrium salamandrivorans]|uniref:Uncharacterized protein n=1 Tax=Batrachochytrium salamandrivorans TaxID=1357716 RepID=A0ABQ8FRN9_9FUNG|nr:hypothetical protein BASA62_004391 [Batrachochytrium salamandrivorans]KAH6583728.1 hypothetical protein BASA60_001295 [Batrachochytrium salamandrivorans]KAH6601564.1 hypothetical protein BASA50_001512 [Batrachochytrium salamandrivorans]KAH9245597.1 hypothetical protein BASA81_016909 [Batrachochytrium salamandrivorans]KAH9250300.1 hypothetical protein BASA81_011917 [Batrachochytrium salamandrivorans]